MATKKVRAVVAFIVDDMGGKEKKTMWHLQRRGCITMGEKKEREKKKKNVYLYNEVIKPPGRVNCRLWNRNEALECLADEDEG